MNNVIKYGLIAVIGVALYLFFFSGPSAPSNDVQPPSAVNAPPPPPAPAPEAPKPAPPSPPPAFGQAEALAGQLGGGSQPAAPGARPALPGAPAPAAPGSAPAGSAATAAAGTPFDAASAQSIMMNAMPALGSCLEGGSSTALSINFELRPDGKAQSVRVQGPVAAPAERCMRDVMSRVKFSSFDGEPRQLSFPLTVYQKQGTTQTTILRPVNSPNNPSGGQPIDIQP